MVTCLSVRNSVSQTRSNAYMRDEHACHLVPADYSTSHESEGTAGVGIRQAAGGCSPSLQTPSAQGHRPRHINNKSESSWSSVFPPTRLHQSFML
ncbi:hypothetical protein GOODEAATRI_002455 [Goodea atripinnis]|uniref:Uncharacterized protein n=1 Tax=Goodea atripinnis TaxID=208336 RepID=A0ABV0PAT5_9TELE